MRNGEQGWEKVVMMVTPYGASSHLERRKGNENKPEGKSVY
jgi:hypothetical protein